MYATGLNSNFIYLFMRALKGWTHFLSLLPLMSHLRIVTSEVKKLLVCFCGVISQSALSWCYLVCSASAVVRIFVKYTDQMFSCCKRNTFHSVLYVLLMYVCMYNNKCTKVYTVGSVFFLAVLFLWTWHDITLILHEKTFYYYKNMYLRALA